MFSTTWHVEFGHPYQNQWLIDKQTWREQWMRLLFISLIHIFVLYPFYSHLICFIFLTLLPYLLFLLDAIFFGKCSIPWQKSQKNGVWYAKWIRTNINPINSLSYSEAHCFIYSNIWTNENLLRCVNEPHQFPFYHSFLLVFIVRCHCVSMCSTCVPIININKLSPLI